jgi:hypothetical protein
MESGNSLPVMLSAPALAKIETGKLPVKSGMFVKAA